MELLMEISDSSIPRIYVSWFCPALPPTYCQSNKKTCKWRRNVNSSKSIQTQVKETDFFFFCKAFNLCFLGDLMINQKKTKKTLHARPYLLSVESYCFLSLSPPLPLIHNLLSSILVSKIVKII